MLYNHELYFNFKLIINKCVNGIFFKRDAESPTGNWCCVSTPRLFCRPVTKGTPRWHFLISNWSTKTEIDAQYIKKERRWWFSVTKWKSYWLFKKRMNKKLCVVLKSWQFCCWFFPFSVLAFSDPLLWEERKKERKKEKKENCSLSLFFWSFFPSLFFSSFMSNSWSVLFSEANRCICVLTLPNWSRKKIASWVLEMF